MSLPGYKPKTRKAPWTMTQPAEPPALRRRVRPVSRRRQAINREYRKKAEVYLAQYPRCRCSYEWGLGCGQVATEIHHIRGRHGSLLMNDRFWLGVCREAHTWIHNHVGLARANGWLALPGEWGQPGDDAWKLPR